MENHVVLTKEGLKQLQDRLDYLKNVKRPECTKAIAAARAFGDLSENSEYVAAKEEQSMCESEINDLEEKIRNAKIINDGDIDASKVSLGCTVTLQDLTFDENESYAEDDLFVLNYLGKINKLAIISKVPFLFTL